MNAGYVGYSKSVRAVLAEQDGLMNASQLVQYLRKKKLFPGITTKIIKQVLPPTEWHHTSKFFNETNYFELATVFQHRKALRAAIASEKQKPKKKVIYFKCWNIWDDVRKWDWTFTTREGKYTYTLEQLRERLDEVERQLQENQSKKTLNKTQLRILREKEMAVEKIKAALQKEMT